MALAAPGDNTAYTLERVIKSTSCLQILPNGRTDGVCNNCISLLKYKHPFRNALSRVKERRKAGKPISVRSTGLGSRADLQKQLRELKRKLRHSVRAQVRAESRLIASSKQPLPVRDPACQARYCLKIGDTAGATAHLKRVGNPQCNADCTVNTAEEINETAAHVAAEILRKKRAYRTPQQVKDFLAVLRILAGRQVYKFVAMNLNLPSEASARRWRPDVPPFTPGISTDNFMIAKSIYEDVMKRRGVPTPVPCLLSEDETAVNAVLCAGTRPPTPSSDHVVGTAARAVLRRKHVKDRVGASVWTRTPASTQQKASQLYLVTTVRHSITWKRTSRPTRLPSCCGLF